MKVRNMNSIEDLLEQITDTLQKLYGLPAGTLVLFSCIVIGYVLKLFKKFPNDGIPIAVILWGGVLYPLIADSDNDLTLRVWLVRNLIIGLVIGFAAWLLHNKILSKLEEKLGLFGEKTTTTPDPLPPTTTPPQ